MSPEQKKAYLANNNKCPHCQSDNLVMGKMQTDDSRAWCVTTCETCEASWEDVYRLVDVLTRNPPNPDSLPPVVPPLAGPDNTPAEVRKTKQFNDWNNRRKLRNEQTDQSPEG